MSTLNDSDILITSSNGTNYQIRNDQMSTVNDTDLFIVERAGTQYQVTGADLKLSFLPQDEAPTLADIILAANNSNTNRFTDADYNITLVMNPEGIPISAKALKAEVRGQLSVIGETSEITGITPGSAVFSTTLYTGNYAALTVNTGIDNVNNDSLIWLKASSNPYTHNLYDTKRGRNYLQSNETTAAGDVPDGRGLASFTNNGFSLGESYNNENLGDESYVAWNFRAASGFFDIQTFSGEDTTDQVVPHNLGSIPGLIIVKTTNGSNAWFVYHKDLGTGYYLNLNDPDAASEFTTAWGSTPPTSTTFNIRSGSLGTAAGTENVAYLFADTPGLIKCGSFTGTSFIDCGFEPQWLLVKKYSDADDWAIFDNKRPAGTEDYAKDRLKPNDATGTTGPFSIFFKENGFQNASYQGDCIYVAIAKDAESNPVLTLASATESLTNGGFISGDIIKQNNSPVTASSSAITNVNGITAVAASITWSGGVGATTQVAYGYGFTGNNNAAQADLVASYTTTGSAIAFKVSNWPATGTGIEIKSGSDTLQVGRVILQEGTGTTFDQVVIIPVTSSTGYIYLRLLASTAGAQYNIDLAAEVPPVSTVLTLTNSDGLSDLEVGDVVQETVTGSYLKDTVPPAGLKDLTLTDTHTQRDWDLFIANQTSAFSFSGTYLSFLAGVSIAFDYVSASGGTVTFAFGAPTTMALSGDVNNAGDQAVTGNTSGSPSDISIQLQAGHGQFVLTPVNGCYLYGRSAFGSFSDVKITAINPLVPDVTTDGGAWNVGEVITGPSKDITATFVSADPSVPSMEVSNLVGPWSANTGNHVVNTVTNPVFVTPKTSTIVNISELLIPSGIPAASNVTSSTSLGQITLPPVGTLYSINVSITDWELASYMQLGFSKPDSKWSGAAYNATNNGLYQYAATPQAEFNGGLGLGPSAGTAGQNMKYADTSTNANWLEGTNSGSAEFIYDSDGNVWLRLNNKYIYTTTVNPVVFDPYSGLAGNPMWTGLDSTYYFGYLTRTGPSYPTLAVDDDGVSLGTTLTLFDDTDLVQFATGDNVYAADFESIPVFSTTLYNGNATPKTVVTGIDNTSKALAWIKGTTHSNDHTLIDSTTNGGQFMSSNAQTNQRASGCTLVNNGLTIPSGQDTNKSGEGFVAWNFRAAPKFFDVVYYLGSSSPQSIPHNLGSKPGFTIIKCTNYSSDWKSYHGSLGATKYLGLNSNIAADTATSVWNDTEPTSTEFTVGTSTTVNGVDRGFIAYLFADEPGLIKCGGYTGQNNDGRVISTGFKVGWLLIKNTTDNSTNWALFDDKRPSGEALVPNSSSDSSDLSPYIALDANDGFIIKSNFAWTNEAGSTFVYVAVAEDAKILPPTGVVSNVTGLNMTLSSVTGDWETGQQATMDEKESVLSRLYCELDSLGNVLDLTSVDPGYTVQSSDSATPIVSFPTQFASGEDPDTILPAGTSLKVYAQASNESGSDTAESNTLFP